MSEEAVNTETQTTEVPAAETAQTTETVVAPTEAEIKFSQDMAFALDDPSLEIKFEKPEVSEASTEAAGTDLKPNVSHEASETTAAQPSDINNAIKEHFGVDTIEEAKKQWTELQALKEKSNNGIEASPEKLKEIYQALDRQEKIGSLLEGKVTKDNAPAIIKAAMVEKYKGLSPEMVNHKFNKQFAIPKEPVEDKFLSTDDYEEAKAEWEEAVKNTEMEMLIEANLVRPELEKVKSEIKIPNIQAEAVVNEELEAYKASNAKAADDHENIIAPAIKSLKESDVPLGFKVEDAGNQMEFDISIVPTPEDFEQAKQDSLSLTNFLSEMCYDKDGKFIPQNIQRIMLLAKNYDKYAQSIARQAVNAERKRVIAKEAPNGMSSGRDFEVNTEKSEFQKQMDFALS